MGNFLTNLFSAGASNLVDAVGSAIDKNFTTDEEKKELENEIHKASLQYEVQMAKLSLEEKIAVMADTADARMNQTRIQESENASWLAKNVHPFLAIFIVGLTFFLFFWLLIGNNLVKAANSNTKDIIIYILGALTTIVTQVVAYYFGSSLGSKDKQKSLETMAATVTKKQ